MDVNSSYIANAFPNFSQSLSERSIEVGRAARTKERQSDPAVASRAVAPLPDIVKANRLSTSKQSKAAQQLAQSSPPATPQGNVSNVRGPMRNVQLKETNEDSGKPKTSSPELRPGVKKSRFQGNALRDTSVDQHAHMMDETELSRISDERPTTTFTVSKNKSRFQAPRAISDSSAAWKESTSNAFEAISSEFDAAFKRAGSVAFGQYTQHTITPPDSEQGDKPPQSTGPHKALNTDIEANDFARVLHSVQAQRVYEDQRFAQQNETQMSYTMPEIADITRLLNGSYKDARLSQGRLGHAEKFSIHQRPHSAGVHNSIGDVPVPFEEKDLYLSIQALQIQVQQLKDEKQQQLHTTGLVNAEIETLRNALTLVEQRNVTIEKELVALKAEKADGEELGRQQFAGLQSSTQAQLSDLKEKHRMEIESLQERAEKAEANADSLQEEVTKVRKLIVRSKDAENARRTEVQELHDEIKVLQADLCVEIASNQELRDEIDLLKAEKIHRQESDGILGEDEKAEIHSLKTELDQAHQEIAQSHTQVQLALTTIDKLREEYLKLQQRAQPITVNVGRQGREDKPANEAPEEDARSHSDEPTMRPVQDPGTALRAAIDRLAEGLAREQASLAQATREYNDHQLGYRGRERKALKEKMEMLVAGVEERHEVLYDLHDVLESGL